jgi:hypothetical protein
VTLESFSMIAGGTINDVTYVEPRISFVESLGSNTCTLANQCPANNTCTNNICVPTPLAPDANKSGRFVVAIVDPTRTIRFYRSADAVGNGSGAPEVWTSLPITGAMLPKVDCPTFAAGTGAARLSSLGQCRMIMPTVGTASLGGTQTECVLDVGLAGVTVASCATALSSTPTPFMAGLAQSGPDGVAGHRTTTGWVTSFPVQAPHLATSNSETILFTQPAANALLETGVTFSFVSSDAGTCVVQAGALPRSYTGGNDIAQAAGTMVAVQMSNDIGSVNSKCW